jgi:subtilisin-like proprotein convertase family protein
MAARHSSTNTARRPLAVEPLEDRTVPAGWAFGVGENVQSVALDPAGNMYVTGSFRGTIDFDPDPTRVVSLSTSNSDDTDTFLAKYSPDQQALWVRRIGGATASDSDGSGVEVGPDGNVYLACWTYSAQVSISGTGGYVGPTLAPVGTANSNGWYVNGIVARFSPDGAADWARRYGGTGTAGGYFSGHQIAVGRVGPDGPVTVTVAGHLSGTVDFDPQTARPDDTLTSAGGSDVYVARYDGDGAFQWARSAGGAGGDVLRGVAVDAAGNAYVAGRFPGTATFGTTSLTAVGGGDGFLTKLDAAGTFLWTRQVGGATAGASVDSVQAVRVFRDPVSGAETVYAGGCFATDATGPAQFGPTLLTSADAMDSFVSRLTPDGDFLWTRPLAQGRNNAVLFDLAADAAGAVYSTGYFYGIGSEGGAYTTGYNDGATDFDPSDAGTALLQATGERNQTGFVAKLAADGGFVWAGRMGAAAAGATTLSRGNGLTVDAAGGVYVASYGSTYPTTFDTGLGTTSTAAPNSNSPTVAGFVSRVDLAGITGRAVADLNGNGTPDSGETLLSGWTAYLDANQNGALDAGERTSVTDYAGRYGFGDLADGTYTVRLAPPAGWALPAGGTQVVSYSAGQTVTGQDLVAYRPTATATRTATPNAAIRDERTTSSALAVSGLPADRVLDLNVTVRITHPNVGDLTITLVAPNGTRVFLSEGNGGAGDNYTNTTFDDEAAVGITAGAAPFSGTYRPEGWLGTFDNANPNGTWRLEVYDGVRKNTGTLVNWSLAFTVPSSASPLVAAGTAPGQTTGEPLTADGLRPLVVATIDRWAAAGATPAQLAVLRAADVRVADLGGTFLGTAYEEAGAVVVDDDAAGWGWFVDPTPDDDAEFLAPGDRGEQGRVDLLSVLMHEFGHLLGLDHDAEGVMAEALAAGERVTPGGVYAGGPEWFLAPADADGPATDRRRAW